MFEQVVPIGGRAEGQTQRVEDFAEPLGGHANDDGFLGGPYGLPVFGRHCGEARVQRGNSHGVVEFCFSLRESAFKDIP